MVDLMRAKDYLAEFHKMELTVGLVEAEYQIFVAMSAEMCAIIKARRAQSPSSIMSVMEEMNGRWNAMRRKGARIPRDEFRRIYLEVLAKEKKEAEAKDNPEPLVVEGV
jgi:hypothetical protein